MRYKFFTNGNKVVCVSSYARRAVRGVAKCNVEQDTFDLDTGKKLAQLRCDKNIALRRCKRASKQYNEAMKAYNEAEKNLLKMRKYYEDSEGGVAKAYVALNRFRDSL